MRPIYSLLLLLVPFAATSGALGQVTQETSPGGTSAPEYPPGAASATDTPGKPDSTVSGSESKDRNSEVEELKKKIEAMQKQRDADREEYAAKFEQLEKSSIEEGTTQAEAGVSGGGVGFSGFFDTSFMTKFPGKGTPVEHAMSSPLFTIHNFNLMATSQMTDKISFLGELRFTFLPNGEEPYWRTQDATLPRTDTTVVETYAQKTVKLGGISIERVYVKWMPWEFFGVIAGYYLTPYGIWHLDHGSPTRLGVLHPFEINTMVPYHLRPMKVIPDAQLGLQALGRLFPTTSLYLDYAFTLSNGRGPADTVIDYDNNKAVGLRLKLSYLRPDFEIALGGYGYNGKYTDKKVTTKNIFPSYDTVLSYKEYAAAIDFLIAFYGVRIQAEYLHNLVYYGDIRPYDFTIGGYKADFSVDAMYAMLSYRLPLDSLLDGMVLTPYIGVAGEYPYSVDIQYFNAIWCGLNFKPSSWITIKTEVPYLRSTIGSKAGGNVVKMPFNAAYIWSWNTQLAASF